VSRLFDFIRRALTPGASTHYRILNAPVTTDGWREEATARHQHSAWSQLLTQMHAGEPRSDLVAAADALRRTGIADPRVVEIGCGTGYYSEIFATLFGPVRYIGVDYSPAMIGVAHRTYPRATFLVGDATRMPLEDRSCDVAFSGNSLMHIADYAAAIAETVRISSRWCVFHSVPVLENRNTTMLQKRAYGAELFEVVFNRSELERAFSSAGIIVEAVLNSVPYDITRQVGETAEELTYVCSRRH
jgi:SAM-dependent methyltransferase